jgi:hypothetical protein
MNDADVVSVATPVVTVTVYVPGVTVDATVKLPESVPVAEIEHI